MMHQSSPLATDLYPSCNTCKQVDMRLIGPRYQRRGFEGEVLLLLLPDHCCYLLLHVEVDELVGYGGILGWVTIEVHHRLIQCL